MLLDPKEPIEKGEKTPKANYTVLKSALEQMHIFMAAQPAQPISLTNAKTLLQ